MGKGHGYMSVAMKRVGGAVWDFGRGRGTSGNPFEGVNTSHS